MPLCVALVALVVTSGVGTAHARSCDHWSETRQAFFGDVHVHTSLSFDAWQLGTRVGPRDAFRFARGEPVGLAPYDALGAPTRIHQLRRPLDFAAVTDHAEMLGETSLCTVGGLNDPGCAAFSTGSPNALLGVFGGNFFVSEPFRHPLCGSSGALCLAAAAGVWNETNLAAEDFNDPLGDCSFSTFAGYEWTAMPGGDTLHRNVLFRNQNRPSSVLSYVEVQSARDLWMVLESQCAAIGGGCEALTIPHNSNLSGGQTFRTTEPDGSPLSLATALLGIRMEPLVELIQHKGDSECRLGVGTTDELCEFEKLPGPPPAPGEESSFVRNALTIGLQLESSLGVNPFAFGLIGSTDTHNGIPGATSEDDYPGHAGLRDDRPELRLADGWAYLNPGGLMVLWANENSRDSLFDAMQRRESYATSGTRPLLRFFGGFDLPPGLCDSGNLVEQGYAQGVPMGGRLQATASSPAPRFVVHASQDPGSIGHPGTPLSEIQLVKSWLDGQGVARESIVALAGAPPGDDAVDPLTCETDGSGFATLCAEWQDPDFDPEDPALYYVRVLERPTCRWSQHLCIQEGIDCSGAIPTGFEACCDGSIPATIQERATSSPIWLRPVPEPGLPALIAIGGIGIAVLGRHRNRVGGLGGIDPHPAALLPARVPKS